MRKKLHLWHRYLGLLVAIPIIIISLTGSILVFKDEVDNFMIPELVEVNAEPGTRLNYDKLMNLLNSKLPNYEVGSWEVFDNGTTADRVYLIKHDTVDWYKVYLDQYNGIVLSEPVALDHYLTDWLLDLHYKFLIGDTGLWFTGFISLILLFMGITGLIIYRQFWKRFFTLRLNLKKVVVFSDIHKLVGIWSAPILVVLGFTGVYWNVTEIIHHEFEHSHDEEHIVTSDLYNQQLSLDKIVTQSKIQMGGFKPNYIIFPFEPDLQLTLFGEVNDISVVTSEYSSMVNFDKQSGELLSNYDIREASLFSAVVDSFRKIHFGYFAGLPSRIIWFVIGLTPLVFAITGTYLWIKRSKPFKRAKKVA